MRSSLITCKRNETSLMMGLIKTPNSGVPTLSSIKSQCWKIWICIISVYKKGTRYLMMEREKNCVILLDPEFGKDRETGNTILKGCINLEDSLQKIFQHGLFPPT